MTGTQAVGFIGTGAITAAVVKGLCSKNRAPTIYLSPRSHNIATALAEEFSNVHQEHSNASVVEKSQIVVLSVRPEQLNEALHGLTFRADQTVISFVATVPLDRVAQLVAPAINICRVTPLCTIEKRQGPIVMTPGLTNVKTLFKGLGDILITDTEEKMMAFGCAAAVLSTFLELQHTVAQWLIGTGVSPSSASLYVRSMFSGIANSALDNQDTALTIMTRNNETPGGLNERVRLTLQESGVFDQIQLILSELASLSLIPSSTNIPKKPVI